MLFFLTQQFLFKFTCRDPFDAGMELFSIIKYHPSYTFTVVFTIKRNNVTFYVQKKIYYFLHINGKILQTEIKWILPKGSSTLEDSHYPRILTPDILTIYPGGLYYQRVRILLNISDCTTTNNMEGRKGNITIIKYTKAVEVPNKRSTKSIISDIRRMKSHRSLSYFNRITGEIKGSIVIQILRP